MARNGATQRQHWFWFRKQKPSGLTWQSSRLSRPLWRSLTAVGNAETVEVLGTPYCGKGEPNQAIRVGHASPACVFSDVDVFGGE